MKANMRFVLFVLLLAAACSRDTRPVIGVVPKGTSHLFWQTVHAGAIKAGREFGYRIEWNAPALEIDSSRQIGIVESMVNRRLAGIALAPVDRQALSAVVERASKANVPVAIFDSAIETPSILTYVATNNAEGGRMAARRIGELIGGKGKVAIIGFMPGSASTMEREDGFAGEIRTKYPGINVVALQFGNADRSKAMAVTENVLAAHPDLAALFADNESSLSGAVQALKARKAKHVKLVGFDTSEQLAGDMKEGWIDAFVVQDPFRMGYESVRMIALSRASKPVERVVDTGVRLVTSREIDRPDVKAFLFPDLKQWLGH